MQRALTLAAKVCREIDAKRMLAGKLFHTRRLATAKLWCQVQSWFLEQWDIDCQQTKGVVYRPQLWQARSRWPDMEAPTNEGTCRQSSPNCTWFDYVQEASKVHAAPVRCDQTFWLLSQHVLLHGELSTASSASRHWHRTILRKTGCELVLFTNMKSHISFRLVPNTVTSNDLEVVITVTLYYYTKGRLHQRQLDASVN